MSTTVGVMRAECADCGWEYDRGLDAGESLDKSQNREIAARVVRAHAFKCGARGRRSEWGETSAVELYLE